MEGEPVNKLRKFVPWEVYPLTGGGYAVSNLTTTLRIKGKGLALRVAASKNRNKRIS
jgi:hypothetical protein